MTQPMPEPTLGEVARTLDRFEKEVVRRFDEINAHMQRVVITEVYDAHRAALGARIDDAEREVAEVRTELDTERRERRADRRVYIGALLSLLAAVVAAGVAVALGWK